MGKMQALIPWKIGLNLSDLYESRFCIRELTEEFIDSDNELNRRAILGRIYSMDYPSIQDKNSQTIIVEEDSVSKPPKVTKIAGRIFLNDDFHRCRILEEVIEDESGNIERVPIHGSIKYDDKNSKIYELSIDPETEEIKKRLVKGKLKRNKCEDFGLPADYYSVIEQYDGMIKPVSGELEIGSI